MKKVIFLGNAFTHLLLAKKIATLRYLIVSLLIAALPGISVGQCPSSYNGFMANDGPYGPMCGFRSIEVRLNLTGVSSVSAFGRVTVVFSNNVKIYSVTPETGMTVYSFSDYNADLRPGAYCEPVSIGDGERIATIVYAVLTGNTASSQTQDTRLNLANAGNPCTPYLCPNYSDASAVNISQGTLELHGNILAPGEFSCSGGISTDHGLPERFVTIKMADDPYHTICEDIETNAYGYYECTELRDDCDYTICIEKEDEYCGIDEFDIDIITDFILRVICPFDYKWQHFSADVNNSGAITTADIVCLERYLLEYTPYCVEPWKYVSFTQYDNFTQTCDDYVYDDVPPVYNCSDINMDTDPTIEDFYGFPSGDVDYTCTTCGFRGKNDIAIRSSGSSKTLTISQNTKNIINIFFDHCTAVNLWSMVLKPDSPVESIIDVKLENSQTEGFLWNINKDENTIKIIYSNFEGHDLNSFNIKITFRKYISSNSESWSLSNEDARLHNILIDKNKNYFYWNNIFNQSPSTLFLYPNPSTNELYLSQFNSNSNEVFLYQIDGKLILNTKLNSDKLDISLLRPGIYFLKYKDPNIDQTLRFIKEK